MILLAHRREPRAASSCCMPKRCRAVPMTGTLCVRSSRILKNSQAARSSEATSTRVTAAMTPRTRAAFYLRPAAGRVRRHQTRIATPLRHRTVERPPQGRRSPRPLLSQRPRWRRCQRHPLRCRTQLPSHPRMAEGSFARPFLVAILHFLIYRSALIPVS